MEVWMTQGRVALAVAAILIVTSPPVLGQSGRARVVVNDTIVAFPESPEVLRGTLVAPLRPLATAFGASVAWDADAPEGLVTSRRGVVVRVAVGDPVAVTAGARIALPVAPFRRGGTVWVPAAALLRALGAHVRLEGELVVEAMSQVTGVTWRRSVEGLVVRVAATGPVTVRSLVLTDPDRIAVDVMHAAASLAKSRIEVDDPDVVAIRAAQFSTQPYVTRIVLDLIHAVPYTVGVETAGVVVTVSPQAATSVPPPVRPAAPAPGPPPAPAQGGTPSDHEHPNGAAAPEPRALPALPEFADGPGAFHVLGVRYVLQDGRGQLTISTSQPVTPVVRQFGYPDRLAIDLPGGVFISRREDLEVGSALIRNIVVAQMQVEPNLTRVVVYLQRKAGYTASPAEGGRGLVFVLGYRPGTETVAYAVVIDPGHGGADSGAIGPTGLRESDVTLGIARQMAEMLERQGVRVVLTRTADTAVALEDRTDIARREHAIAFISIHANASQSSAKKGTETYYASHESEALAVVIQNEIVRVLGEPDRGIRTADFYVIVHLPAPAVLVETAFISNPNEERLLRDPAIQRRIAEAIVRGLMKFLDARTASPAP
jgi:N-acetylmuramoyl-L-alanine amidase